MIDEDGQQRRSGAQSVTTELANALVALHKEQFGRGPTRASARFAGPDALLIVLEDALLPAERELVELGQSLRVVETRCAFQVATERRFVDIIEQITGRTVRSFAGGVDAPAGIAFEVCLLEPLPSDDGEQP
jgi:uncharacterized protein YbcI